MTKKQKLELPSVGDRVLLRGKSAKGTLTDTDRNTYWSRVEWDWGHDGPKIVHLRELEKE